MPPCIAGRPVQLISCKIEAEQFSATQKRYKYSVRWEEVADSGAADTPMTRTPSTSVSHTPVSSVSDAEKIKVVAVFEKKNKDKTVTSNESSKVFRGKTKVSDVIDALLKLVPNPDKTRVYVQPNEKGELKILLTDQLVKEKMLKDLGQKKLTFFFSF